jgi:hypothetical protein
VSKSPSKRKELESLVGHYVLLHVNNLIVTGIDGDMGLGVMTGLEGYIVDVSDNYLYLGRNFEKGFDNIVNLNEILLITLIEIKEETEDNKLKVIEYPKNDK